jgi:AbiV family abortive infection protein
MSSSGKPSFDRAKLSELARGAQKTFENADALFREAKILGAVGALSRALFLHQISLEECAKIENIGAWATSLLAGRMVNGKKVLDGFASHKKKNRTNAYMLEESVEEQAAKNRGD